METTAEKIDSHSTELAKRMYELRNEKQELESKVKDVDAQLDQIRQELTQIMENLGIQKFGLEGIGTFYLATNIYPKILDNDLLVSWLDDHGLASIAPRKVHIPSFKEMFEARMEKDEPVPSAELVDMSSETSVRLRVAKKGT